MGGYQLTNDVKTALFLCIKQLSQGSRLTTALLIFILTVCFLNVIFTSGLLESLGDATEQLVVDTDTAHIVVTPEKTPSRKEFIENQSALRDKIERIPGVAATVRHYITNANVSYDKDGRDDPESATLSLVGVDPAQEKAVLTIAEHMVAGAYPDNFADDDIVLGADISGGYGDSSGNNLGGAKVNDEVTVSYNNGVKRSYIVRGIYKVGFYSGNGYILAKEIESALSLTNEASEILVKADLNRDDLSSYQSQIQETAPKLTVQKYTELLGESAAIIGVFNGIALIISVIGFMVAAITIFVLIYTNALNKRRQIGILKAIGLKKRVICLSYVFQALFFALGGFFLAAIIVFLLVIPLLKAYPIEIAMGNIGIATGNVKMCASFVSMCAVAILAGAIPSERIARKDILESIKGG